MLPRPRCASRSMMRCPSPCVHVLITTTTSTASSDQSPLRIRSSRRPTVLFKAQSMDTMFASLPMVKLALERPSPFRVLSSNQVSLQDPSTSSMVSSLEWTNVNSTSSSHATWSKSTKERCVIFSSPRMPRTDQSSRSE